MASLDLVIIAAYMVGMVAVGFWTQRKATNQEQFLVAGRSVGPLLYSGTLAAIIIGGGATIGGVKLGYTYGISGMWLVSMYGLGMIVMGVVLVGRRSPRRMMRGDSSSSVRSASLSYIRFRRWLRP